MIPSFTKRITTVIYQSVGNRRRFERRRGRQKVGGRGDVTLFRVRQPSTQVDAAATAEVEGGAAQPSVEDQEQRGVHERVHVGDVQRDLQQVLARQRQR